MQVATCAIFVVLLQLFVRCGDANLDIEQQVIGSNLVGQIWKNGRGKLGIFAPVLGHWRTKAESSIGVVICTRTFKRVLDGKYVQLNCRWEIGTDGKTYDEQALFGVRSDKTIRFWSFTSDGKQSEGWLSTAPDIHPKALCFEADMDAGRARQTYWPDADEGVHWAVENRTKKGWSRFVDHLYLPYSPLE